MERHRSEFGGPRDQTVCLGESKPPQPRRIPRQVIVLLELVKSKCMPILLYGLECFFLVLPKSDVQSLDFVVTRFLMKLFRTVNHDVIRDL